MSLRACWMLMSLWIVGLGLSVAGAQDPVPGIAADDPAMTGCERVSSTGGTAPHGYIPPPIRSGGPTTLWTAYALEGISSSTFTQPKVADLDQDGNKEIISALRAVRPGVTLGVYAWNCEGQLKDGFPVLLQDLNTVDLRRHLSIVAVGDVCRDQNLEIVVATGHNRDDTDFCGGVYVISHAGEIIAEIETGHGFSCLGRRRVVLSDFDRDGKAEIIATDVGKVAGDPDSGRTMYVWTAQGDEFVDFPGWPIILHNEEVAVYCSPAVAEVNDQKLIIANVGTPDDFGECYKALDIHGQIVWSADTPDPANPLVGDVNNDGTLEVVGKTTEWDYFEYCIILDMNGNTLHRWRTQESWSYGNGMALGDLDHDGTLEVVHHDDTRVFVRDYAGDLWPGFWRVIWDGDPAEDPYRGLTNLGVADLDGDGYPDIYGLALYNFRDGSQGSYQNSVFAFDGFGNTLSGFPFHLINQRPFPPGEQWTSGEMFPPTFADINNDGIADMVTSKGWGRIEAFTLNVAYRQRTAHFPEYGANVRNTRLVQPCPGDLDGDGDTDQADLGMLLADWGCSGGDCPGDCDFDGDTDQSDLGILLADWGCQS